MSTAIFPTLPIAFPVKRTPQFKTQTVESVSGKEVRIALQSQPRYIYEISYEVLRKNASTAEYQTLMAFYNNRLGGFDTFLYDDPDDDSVTGQTIVLGDSVTTSFQLLRSFGGVGFGGGSDFVDIVLAPNVVSAVYINGAIQDSFTYTISNWGSTLPGVITFTSPPPNGVAVTADFTYYWPCRFMTDTLEFEKFFQGFYSVKSLKFITVK